MGPAPQPSHRNRRPLYGPPTQLRQIANLPPAMARLAALLALTLSALAAAEAPPDDDVCPAGSPGCVPALDDQVDLMQFKANVRGKRQGKLEPALGKLEPAHLGVQKHIAGVPVYNYHLAYPSGANPSAWSWRTRWPGWWTCPSP